MSCLFLTKLGRAIIGGATQGLIPLLSLIHSQTGRLMNADNFFIAIYDDASESVEFKFAMEESVRQEIGKNEWCDAN